MLYVVFAPKTALQSTFGEALDGPVADVIVRNWGSLIVLVGIMLIYGALSPPVRPLVLSVAAIGKLIFVGLVLFHGKKFLGYQAGISIIIDSLMVLLFALYLIRSSGKHQK